MDQNQPQGTRRPKLERLIGVAAFVLIGSIAGIVGGAFIADFIAEPSVGGKLTWLAKRERLFTLCLFSGLVVGAVCGYAICEIPFRRKLSKN